MTLSTTTVRTSYPGTASVGPFTVPFRFFANSDLVVVRRGASDTTLAYLTDYTVSGAGNSTGSVTLITALAAGETIVIRRALPVTQATSVRNQGAYYGATHEDQFDRTVMVEQQLQDQLDRSLHYALYDHNAPSGVVPSPSGQTGKVLASDGSGWTLSTIGTSSGLTLPGKSRTVASLAAYLENNAFYSVRDYGGTCDQSRPLSTIYATLAAAQAVYPHVTALTQELDWAASQAAINNAPNGAIVFWPEPKGGAGPPNVYHINDQLIVDGRSGLRLLAGGVSTKLRWNGAVAASSAMLKIRRSSYIIVDGLRVECLQADQPAYGFWITSDGTGVTQFNHLLHCHAYGVSGIGFKVGDTNNLDTNVDGNLIDECLGDQCGYAAVQIDGSNTNLTKIRGGAYGLSTTAGALIQIGTFARQVIIEGVLLTDTEIAASCPGLIRISNKFSGIVRISDITVELYRHKLLYTDASDVTNIGSGQIILREIIWTCNFFETGVAEDKIIEYLQHGHLHLENVYGAGRSDGSATYIAIATPNITGPGARRFTYQNLHLYPTAMQISVTQTALAPTRVNGDIIPAAGVSSSAGQVLPLNLLGIPAFLAYVNAAVANVTGNATIYTVVFDAEVYDDGGNFDTGTGTFAAPVSGRYKFEVVVGLAALTVAMTLFRLRLVTSNRNYLTVQQVTPIAAGQYAVTLSCTADMDAGDTASVTITVEGGAGDTAGLNGITGSTLRTYFSGSLLAR